MPVNFIPSSAEILRMLPEIILSLAGTLIMVLTPLMKSGRAQRLGYVSFSALAAAAVAAVVANTNPGEAFQDMIWVDGFSTFFRVLVITVGALTVLSSFQYLRRERVEPGEFHALLLFSVAGQCVMVAANELIVMFIGLEISSISSYILAGYVRDDRRANESALKYFLLGSFATAFLLYGVAWTYGLTGSTNFGEIHSALAALDSLRGEVLVAAAAALIFVGLAFKVSAWPFQIWAPDVYQGAPAPVAGFLSAGPKAAAFAVLIRVFEGALDPISIRWQPFIWASALLTMTIGNFAALSQSNIKRLLAYSSIAHAGYVLVAVTAHSELGIAAAMFYLASYALMNIGAFAVVVHVSRQGERYVEVGDFAGLGARHPATAALLAIFLLSLIGVPLTGGFFGKFYVFKAALDANMVWLTVLGLLNSAVAAYYYLRILVVMYMHDAGDSMKDLSAPGTGLKVALWSSALGTLVLGIYPSVVLDFASRSAALLR
ncbi:MAG: NADH-quinone oxidoreductase subunit N [Bryobacteraceae bacterium]